MHVLKLASMLRGGWFRERRGAAPASPRDALSVSAARVTRPGLDGATRIDRVALHSYGELQQSQSEVYAPEDVDELKRLFAALRRPEQKGRRVSFRCGGCSIDGQSLNDDVVILLEGLDELTIEDSGERPTITAGPGARWGDIVRALEQRGLVPYVAVTTSRATAGGTMSTDCVSRFTSGHGKESEFVRSFRLLTLDGSEIDVEPPPAPPHAISPANSDYFLGVIGGLGYLGAVISVTYEVCRLAVTGPVRAPLRLRTTVVKCSGLGTFTGPHSNGGVGPRLTKERASFEGFANTIHERIAAFNEEVATGGTTRDQGTPRAFYGVLLPAGPIRGLVFDSTYVRSDALKPMPQHVARHPLRPFAEWAGRSRLLRRLFWELTYAGFREDIPYIDDLWGYMFFMDGNLETHALERRFGVTTCTLQQTYVIPFVNDALINFLQRVTTYLTVSRVRPVLLDVLYVPGDDALLSASRGAAGFAVTIAFEILRRSSAPEIEGVLREVSRFCLEAQGRVHLGKTVCADPDVLQQMYETGLDAFTALKDRVDPGRVLKNEFLERLFPRLAVPTSG